MGRPSDLHNLQFVIDVEKIPQNFYRGIITAASAKHVIFMTDEMVLKLSECRVWFIDGTFRIINKPFMQLLGIHGFITNRLY